MPTGCPAPLGGRASSSGLLLEGGRLRPAREQGAERAVPVAQRLLRWHARHLSEPRRRRRALARGERPRGPRLAHPFPALLPCLAPPPPPPAPPQAPPH